MSLQLAQADLLNLVFDPEKLISSISSEHKTKYKRPGSSYSLHHWEKSPRESRNSHHLITQRDNMHSRAHDMCVDPRGHGTTCSKNRNIVPYHRCARIQRLTVSVPGYGSCWNVIPYQETKLVWKNSRKNKKMKIIKLMTEKTLKSIVSFIYFNK